MVVKLLDGRGLGGEGGGGEAFVHEGYGEDEVEEEGFLVG